MAIVQTKHPMPVQEPEVRAHNFNEVALGYSEETAIGSIAHVGTVDFDTDDDVLEGAGAAAHIAQTANEALSALDGALDHEVLDGGVAHNLEEGHAVVAHVVVDGDGVTLTVERTALERPSCRRSHRQRRHRRQS